MTADEWNRSAVILRLTQPPLHQNDGHRAPQRQWRVLSATAGFSLERGSVQQLFSGIAKSHTRALAGVESSSTIGAMKARHSLDRLLPQEASGPSTTPLPITHWHIRRRDSLPLREAIPLWFAISSPLIGLIIGFLGAWFVTWLTS